MGSGSHCRSGKILVSNYRPSLFLPPHPQYPEKQEGRFIARVGSASGQGRWRFGEREMAGSPARPDTRVRCGSRHWVGEVLGLCTPYVRALTAGQPPGGARSPDRALGENFETAVQENITINGQPWQESSDEAELPNVSDIKILEDQLDEIIVETATKRKQCPRKILVHLVKTMKSEQEMLKLYRPVIKPQDIRASLPALVERAEGFSQALTLQPILELCKLRQEVFSACKAKEENKVRSFISQVEITPTETDADQNPNAILKRKRPADSQQIQRYPLRRKKIALDT
uniref:NSL1 component of MIS12 kinetochore complex n=1 Tax=Sphenodon punctatus TaxID=8508 RepID=A0A8D0HM54_SPHPU